MRIPSWGAALALLLSACQYQVTPDVPDASGPFIGNVTLIWAPTSTAVTADFTTPQFSSVLQFWDAGCAGTEVGSCCMFSQPQIQNPTSGEEPLTVSAGSISVADDNSVLGRLTFSGIGYDPLSSAETPTLLWNPGDTLIVTADGGLVGGFSSAITAPPAFANVAPALSISAQIVVPLTDDFTVTWTPDLTDAGGNVTLEIFDPLGFYVDCVAPDSAGTVTAPAAAFAGILHGDDGYVTLYRPASETLSSANTTVVLTAEATAPGLATFQ